MSYLPKNGFTLIELIVVIAIMRVTVNGIRSQQAVEKLRCILPLPNLFPSLARRFPFPHPLDLRLWRKPP